MREGDACLVGSALVSGNRRGFGMRGWYAWCTWRVSVGGSAWPRVLDDPLSLKCPRHPTCLADSPTDQCGAPAGVHD